MTQTSSSVKFQPLHDRVLVKRLEEDEKTPGGILIPDTAKEKPIRGIVIAAGKGARTEDGRLLPMDIKEGDTVVFGKWSGTEIKLEGHEYVVLKETDILGRVNA